MIALFSFSSLLTIFLVFPATLSEVLLSELLLYHINMSTTISILMLFSYLLKESEICKFTIVLGSVGKMAPDKLSSF